MTTQTTHATHTTLTPRVRITVTTGAGRTDLAMPAQVPIVELLPSLVRRCGVDVGALAAGPRLARLTGELLDPSVPLATLGVVDGDVLVLDSAHAPDPLPVPDDLTEAVNAVATALTWTWTAAAGSVAAAAAVPVLLGGAAVLVAGAGLGAVGTALLATGAVLTVLSAAWAARLTRAAAAAALLVTAVAYAVCAAVAVAGSTDALLVGSAAAAATAAVGAAAVPACRIALGVWALVAAALSMTAGLGELTDWPPVAVLAAVLASALLLAPAAPSLAGAVSGLSAQAVVASWDTGAPQRKVRRALGDRVRKAHDVLLGCQAALSTVVLVAIPQLSSTGGAGVALATAGSTALVLRSRRAVTRAAAALALASGIAGFALIGLVSQTSGRSTQAAAVLAVAGLVACWRALRGRASSPRLTRLYGLLDTATQVCAAPLAVLVIV